MRWLAAVLIALGGVSAAMFESPAAPAPGDHPDPVPPSVAVCPIEEGSGRGTQLSELSSEPGAMGVTVFGGGETPPTLEVTTDSTGAFTVQGAELAAAGRVGALVETSDPESASGVIVTGMESIAGGPCFHGNPSGQTLVSGGVTTEGNEFELHFMNPYSGEAVVNLVVQSESGREVDERFNSLVVPARGSIVFDLTRIIPGRNSVAVTVEPLSGSTWVTATQRRGGENASWRALEAGTDWYLPIPSGPGARLVLATPVNAEVEYQIDLYGPEGLLEAWQSGVLAPRGQAVVDLADLGGAAAAVRIVAAGPLVPSLWMDNPETGLAVTTASPVQAGSWLLPGAGAPEGGAASLVIVNTGLDSAVATVRTVRGVTIEEEVSLPVDAVVEVPLTTADAYRVDTDGSVVVMWVARRGGAAMAAMGVPLADG